MSEKARGPAVWVALIGALASSGGYLLGYFKDLAIEEKSQEHSLILELLDENPRQSSSNLLWAHHAGLLDLSLTTVSALEDDPASAPTRAAPVSARGAFDVLIPSNSVIALVQSLDGAERATRAGALQILLDNHRADEEAVRAVVSLISGDQLIELSANGRINALYFLERVQWSTLGDDAKDATLAALAAIIHRVADGVIVVGEDTRNHITQIQTIVAANRE